MNQYRCETCNRRVGAGGINDCPIGIPHHLDAPRVWLIEKIGCASHSDFQSERDKVMDETSNGVILWSPAHIFRLICRLDETELEYLLSDIRWLQERNFKRNHPELRQVNHEPV